MVVALAVVTFLLSNGSHIAVPVYPPGGDYHRQFGFVCERNRVQTTVLVRTLIAKGIIARPDLAQQILDVRIFCTPSIDL